MSVEENKALIRHYFGLDVTPEMVRTRRQVKPTMEERQGFFRAHFESIFSPDFVGHDSKGDWSREQSLQENLALFFAFPDVSWGLDRMVAEGDLVVVLGKMLGTHLGSYEGIPPSGKKAEIKYTSTYRIADGKVVEAWSSMDWLGLMQQIGAIPTGPPKK